MTIAELQIQFDLNPDNRVDVLKNANTCRFIKRYGYYGYFFVDQEDGQCYLFDKNGNADDISKVKIIGNEAFIYCKSLTYIKIPNSVESIGDWAFWACTSLKSIKIPDSVEIIRNGTFYYCMSLASIKIPNSVKIIGNYAFNYCASLKEVIFKGKTIDQVKTMIYYPWGIEDESVIKTES